MKRFKKKYVWTIKNKRPEDYFEDPFLYYTDEEVERYARCTGIKKAQQRIAYRVLELLGLKPGSSLLDIGSGPGFTAEVYHSEGYKVTCVDLIPKMVEKAKEKGFEAYVGDMRNLSKIFEGRKFDGVVSVSALQWIKDNQEIKKVAQEIYSILGKDGSVVIQFYPKSEKELKEIANIFKKNGFSGHIIIDWPDIPKKRTVYLVMKRN